MSSGVAVNPECIKQYQDLKLGKLIEEGGEKKRIKYIIFGLNPTFTEIVVLKSSTETDYDDFLTNLPEDGCRWAVYDLHYEVQDGGIRTKLCFYSWSPDTAKIKQKMVYASSKDALRKSFDGIAHEFQGTDLSEVAHETIIERVTKRVK